MGRRGTDLSSSRLYATGTKVVRWPVSTGVHRPPIVFWNKNGSPEETLYPCPAIEIYCLDDYQSRYHFILEIRWRIFVNYEDYTYKTRTVFQFFIVYILYINFFFEHFLVYLCGQGKFHMWNIYIYIYLFKCVWQIEHDIFMERVNDASEAKNGSRSFFLLSSKRTAMIHRVNGIHRNRTVKIQEARGLSDIYCCFNDPRRDVWSLRSVINPVLVYNERKIALKDHL